MIDNEQTRVEMVGRAKELRQEFAATAAAAAFLLLFVESLLLDFSERLALKLLNTVYH